MQRKSMGRRSMRQNIIFLLTIHDPPFYKNDGHTCDLIPDRNPGPDWLRRQIESRKLILWKTVSRLYGFCGFLARYRT